MSRRDDARDRRKLALRRETLRTIADRHLAHVGGGSWDWDPTTTVAESQICFTTDCTGGQSAGSRYC